MPVSHHRVSAFIQQLLRQVEESRLHERLGAKLTPMPPMVRNSTHVSDTALNRRWGLLAVSSEHKDNLLDEQAITHAEKYQRNIENYIGTVKVPVGLVGPLRVNGLYAQGDFYLPLATTEAALVASYNRGAQLISEVGGCAAVVLNEGITRVPSFAFESLEDVGHFMVWMLNHTDALKQIAESTTRHGKLVDMRFTVNGNHVYVQFEYTTGNAAGQNMVTIATQAIFNHIMENSPIRPSYGFVETNMSGDKKASAQAFMSVRGKKVTTEVVIPAELLRKRLHVSPQQMLDYWKMACMGSMMSGSFGVQGHYANGLAALYLATGQDVACVAESAIGLTRFDVKADGSFYATVTLPSLTVGTVGGGTGLPSQQACLGLMGINPADEHSALVYAEVCTALALAGELSIVAALSSNEFTRAHQHLAREKNRHDEG